MGTKRNSPIKLQQWPQHYYWLVLLVVGAGTIQNAVYGYSKSLDAFVQGSYYGTTGVDLGIPPPTEPSPNIEVIRVSKPIIVPKGETFDGKGRVYIWDGPGEASQREGQPPMFILEEGANLKNLHMIGAPDGIHALGNNIIDGIVNPKVGEDAISIKGDNVTVRNSEFRGGADKIITAGGKNTVLENNLFANCKRPISIGGGAIADVRGNRFFNVEDAIVGHEEDGHGQNLPNLIRIKDNIVNGASSFVQMEGDKVKFEDYGGHSIKNSRGIIATTGKGRLEMKGDKGTIEEHSSNRNWELDRSNRVARSNQYIRPDNFIGPENFDYQGHFDQHKIAARDFGTAPEESQFRLGKINPKVLKAEKIDKNSKEYQNFKKKFKNVSSSQELKTKFREYKFHSYTPAEHAAGRH